MLGFLGARLGVGLFMEVIMVPYRYQNKKAFLVDRISSHRHTLYASDNRSELLHQSDEQHLLKACLDPVELQLSAASVLYLPVSLVCHPFVAPPVIGISVSQWVGHLQGAIPGAPQSVERFNKIRSTINVGLGTQKGKQNPSLQAIKKWEDDLRYMDDCSALEL
jgi:hypothetical protein